MRAGEVYLLQEKLRENNDFDHLQMLNSVTPVFDNIEFREFMDKTEDLFLTDLERQEYIHYVDSKFDADNDVNVIFGNRNNLMII